MNLQEKKEKKKKKEQIPKKKGRKEMERKSRERTSTQMESAISARAQVAAQVSLWFRSLLAKLILMNFCKFCASSWKEKLSQYSQLSFFETQDELANFPAKSA